MSGLSKLQQAAFAVAGVALVAGISFLLALAGRPEPVLDRVPRDVIERGRVGAPELPRDNEPRRGGGVLVSPSETLIEGVTAGLALPPISVSNRGLERIKIELDFLLVNRFLLRGSPVIEKTPERVAEGQRYIDLSTDKMTLDPGETQGVVARILRRPPNGTLTGTIGITVLDEEDNFSAPEKGDVSYAIQNNLRINSMLYASWADAPEVELAVKQLRGFQVGEREIDFALRLEGQGRTYTPTGEIRIENSDGKTVVRRALDRAQRVPPGAERDIGTVRSIRNLPPGLYEAVGIASVGREKQTVRWAFELDESGNLPTPRAEVALEIRPNTLQPGQDFEVFVQTQNTGSKNFAPQGRLRLYPFGKSSVLAEKSIKLEVLAPKDITETTLSFAAPSRPGNYEVLLDLEAEDRSRLDQRVASFLVQGDPPPGPGLDIRFRDWLSGNPFAALGIGMIAFGLLLALVDAWSIWRSRRRSSL